MIATQLLQWWDTVYELYPWRKNRDPYRVWISEIMLQQTRIQTVIPYYERWMERFPTVEAVANAELEAVLKHWEGLGYYSRARNIHTASKQIVNEYDGQFPSTAKQLLALKGIGRYTAGAIASICFGEQTPVVDGNVIRVLTRVHDIPDDVTKSKTKNQLWEIAGQHVPIASPGNYNQSLMELGQRICSPTKPSCFHCPIGDVCLAKQRGTQMERPVKPPKKKIPHYDVVAGVITNEDGLYLIAQRPLDGMLGGLWEFPGGKLEKGETHAQALIREIDEELGVTIHPTVRLTEIKHAYTHFKITLLAHFATYSSGEIQHLGVLNHAWVTLDEMESYPFARTDLRIIEALKADE